MLFSGGLIPTYLVVSGLGLDNSIWSMIFPSMISTYYLIIMKNYFVSLPASLEEAARIDGANEFVVMTRNFYSHFQAVYGNLPAGFMQWSGGTNGGMLTCISAIKIIKPLQIYLRDVLVNFNSQLATQAQSMMSSHNKVFVQSIRWRLSLSPCCLSCACILLCRSIL